MILKLLATGSLYMITRQTWTTVFSKMSQMFHNYSTLLGPKQMHLNKKKLIRLILLFLSIAGNTK